MEKISIPNIVLTQGETSDTFEIYSKDSLKDFKASFRITNSDGTSLKTKELSHTKEIKNQDSIFNDNLVYTLTDVSQPRLRLPPNPFPEVLTALRLN